MARLDCLNQKPYKGQGQGLASALPASQSPRQQDCHELKTSLGYMVRLSQKAEQSHGKGCVAASLCGSLRSH